jgi:hypothetical protein
MKYTYTFTLSLLMILIFILKVDSLFLKKEVPSNNNIQAIQNKLENHNIVNKNNNLINNLPQSKDNKINTHANTANNLNFNPNPNHNTNLIIDKMEETILKSVAQDNKNIKNFVKSDINSQVNQIPIKPNPVVLPVQNNTPNKIVNEKVDYVNNRVLNTNFDIKKVETQLKLDQKPNIPNVSLPEKTSTPVAATVPVLKEQSIQYSKVEINEKKRDFTPEYAKPQEVQNDMKSAILVNKDDTVQLGITERPNFLSSVIHPHAIKVSTPTHLYNKQDNTPTFDLEEISNIIN